MAPLGMVLLVQEVRGSYAVAGVVTAAFALGAAVGTPGWGRLVDHLGQPRVIGPTGAASGLFLAGVAVASVTPVPDGALAAVAAAAGVTFPPITPAMRGAWRVVLADEGDRRAAYALDAVAVETIFVGGPLLLSLLLVVAPPIVPLLVTAALLAGGAVAYGATHAARAWRPEPHPAAGDGAAGGEAARDGGSAAAPARGASPLRARGVGLVLAVALLMAVAFGQIDVSIAATARESLGDPSRVGLLFACIAGGSALGGLWYGSRSWRGPERRRLPLPLAVFTAGALSLGLLLAGTGTPGDTGVGPGASGPAGGAAPGAAAALQVPHPPLAVLLVLLFASGLAIAPALIAQANLVDEFAPRDRLNEAQAWLNTAFTAGAAAGTAIAGVLIEAGGPGRAFLGAASALVLATAGAVLGQRSWRGAGPGPPRS
jgi:hypothetical protein